MQTKKLRWISILGLCLGITLFLAISAAQAQQDIGRINIIGSDSSSAPTFVLHVLAFDSQGNPIELTSDAIVVTHGGQPVSNVTIGESQDVGTFTLFLLDATTDIAPQLGNIQESIKQFAADPYMTESADYVAIYYVDELAAVQILAPTEFHNTVQNAFANPLVPNAGRTALVDSLMNILNNLDTISPSPNLAPNIVVFSDGSDVVSTQFQQADVPAKAAELGIPIHTVHLDNPGINDPANKERGRQYMAQIASSSGGVSTTLTAPESLLPIWQSISSSGRQTTIQYTLDNPVAGDQLVEVSAASNPAVKDSTTVSIAAAAPSVVLNLLADSPEFSLENLNEPVSLRFSTEVSWIDNVQRQITKADLMVNGVIVQPVDVAQLSEFETQISNIRYGSNTIQVAVTDDQGGSALSPAVSLNIVQGETQLPEAVDSSGGGLFSGITSRVGGVAIFGGGCFLVLLMLLLIVGIGIIGRNSRIIQGIGLTRLLYQIPFLRPYVADAYQVQTQVEYAADMKKRAGRYIPEARGHGKKRAAAFLEIVQSTTPMPDRIDLDGDEFRIGRSSNQAAIVFKNDSTVSRLHATIAREGNDYRIFDERSTSGSFVNEQRVPDYGIQLSDGDEIRLGAVKMRIRML